MIVLWKLILKLVLELFDEQGLSDMSVQKYYYCHSIDQSLLDFFALCGELAVTLAQIQLLVFLLSKHFQDKVIDFFVHFFLRDKVNTTFLLELLNNWCEIILEVVKEIPKDASRNKFLSLIVTICSR